MDRPECASHTGASTHAEHGKRVADMFGRIAGWYDFLNHALSGGQDIYWRYRLARAARPEPGGLILDLAAGTMDVSVELLRQYPSCKVAALDFALPMLENGKAKKLKKGREERIFPVQADGRNLPLPDNSMAAATIAFGIRNILPREAAYAEFLRGAQARSAAVHFGVRHRVQAGLEGAVQFLSGQGPAVFGRPHLRRPWCVPLPGRDHKELSGRTGPGRGTA